MKRVNQFERTDRDITNALLSVMERKSFEKITVQDILDEAMINRSTFYQHFTDKFAILERLQERYIGGITERMDTVMKEENWDLGAINQVFCTYINEHRSKMKSCSPSARRIWTWRGRCVRSSPAIWGSRAISFPSLRGRLWQGCWCALWCISCGMTQICRSWGS